jgi:hypothetical protein
MKTKYEPPSEQELADYRAQQVDFMRRIWESLERAHFKAVQQELERETLTYAPEPEPPEDECPESQ